MNHRTTLIYCVTGTCAISATAKTCVLGDHGVVVDPAGSTTF